MGMGSGIAFLVSHLLRIKAALKILNPVGIAANDSVLIILDGNPRSTDPVIVGKGSEFFKLFRGFACQGLNGGSCECSGIGWLGNSAE